MAERQRKRVSGVEVFIINLYAKRFLGHQTDLFLGGRAVAADGDLGFPGGIFVDLCPSGQGRYHRRALGTSELEDNLCVLAVERGLDGHALRMVDVTQGADLLGDHLQFVIRRTYLAQVEHAHVHILWLTGRIYAYNPETKNVGPGIDA